MTDTQTENQIPQYTTDEVISGLVATTTNVRDWLQWASQQVAHGNAEESQKAIALVESQINELEVGISIASQMLAAAVDVSETLKAQRDEVIEERDTLAKELGDMEDAVAEARDRAFEEAEEYLYEAVWNDMTEEPLEGDLPEIVDDARKERENRAIAILRHHDPDAAAKLEEALNAARQTRDVAEELRVQAEDLIDKNRLDVGLYIQRNYLTGEMKAVTRDEYMAPYRTSQSPVDTEDEDGEEPEDLDTDEYGEGDPDA